MTTSLIIIVFCSILVLGILNIVINLFKLLNQNLKLVKYLDIVNALSTKTSRNSREDITEEALWVLSNTDVIEQIVAPPIVNPIHELKNNVVANNSIGIHSTSTRLSREIVSWIARIDHKRSSMRWQLLNPFTWFYRGVELILMIVVGYPIKQFNPDFDFEGKPWKLVSLLFTLISGFSSIAGLWYTITIK